jgi:hypothetical protein
MKDVTTLVEANRTHLGVMTSEVDAIQIVVWLPTLCRRIGVSHVIATTKVRLGALVDLSTTSAIATADRKPEDKREFQQLLGAVSADFIGVNKNGLGQGEIGHSARRPWRNCVNKECATKFSYSRPPVHRT